MSGSESRSVGQIATRVVVALVAVFVAVNTLLRGTAGPRSGGARSRARYVADATPGGLLAARTRDRRRALALILVPLLAIVAVVVALASDASLHGGITSPSAAEIPQGPTVTVQRRNLEVATTVPGRLVYAPPQTVLDRLSGRITSLPNVGQVIRAGEPLFTVGHTPVILLYGSAPADRALRPADSRGPDVGALNANLAALGYGGGQIKVDDTWQPATTVGVKQLQSHLGARPTGVLMLGTAVFLPTAQIVQQRRASVGTDTASLQPQPATPSASATPAQTALSNGSSGSATPATAGTTTTSTTTTNTTTTGITTTSITTTSGGTDTTASTATAARAAPTAHTERRPQLSRHQSPAATVTLTAATPADVITTASAFTETATAPTTTAPPTTVTAPPATTPAPRKKVTPHPVKTAPRPTVTTPPATTTPLTTATPPPATTTPQVTVTAPPVATRPAPTTTTATATATATTSTTTTAAKKPRPTTPPQPPRLRVPVPLLATSPDQLLVTVELTRAQRPLAQVGRAVTIQFHSGAAQPGTVTQVSAPSAGAPTIVTIAFAKPMWGSSLREPPVSVRFVLRRADGVLAVPRTALVTISGRGPAVEQAGSPLALIPVTTGLTADGYVQISGSDIYAGLLVDAAAHGRVFHHLAKRRLCPARRLTVARSNHLTL